jgi:hypothetical protein
LGKKVIQILTNYSKIKHAILKLRDMTITRNRQIQKHPKIQAQEEETALNEDVLEPVGESEERGLVH